MHALMLQVWGLNLQVEEGKLAGVGAVFIHEAAGKVAAEDGSEVVVGNLNKE